MRAIRFTATPDRPGLMRSLLDSYRLVLSSLWTHGDLVRQVTQRDIVQRYRGSLLGLVWSLATPLLTLALYTFLFGVVFRARWTATGPEGRAEFALILFVGLILHGFLAECLARAPGLMLQYPHLVKRVVFPIEILGWTIAGSALFNAIVAVAMWAVVATLTGHPPGWPALWLPLVLAPLILVGVGLVWFLAATGVFLRDINHVIAFVTMALLFLAPIFYRLDAVPPGFRTLVALNPLTFIVEEARAILVWSRQPDITRLAIALVGAFAFAGLGLAWFQRLRRGFADVL